MARKRMSAQARKDFAVRMAKARGIKIARKRVAIKRQLRRHGKAIDPNTPTKQLRQMRRDNPASNFQVAALRKGKVLYLSGVGLTDNREAAASFTSLRMVRKIAEQVRKAGSRLSITKVAIVSRHDPVTAVRRFLLGEA
jgi:hypothetical protein